MKPAPTLSHALAFIDRNPSACLFPIYPGRKKPPLISRNLASASKDPAQLMAWHRKWNGCNWGCGLNKSNIICADVDTKPGKQGQLSYDVLDLWHGWPPTFTVRTPSGGKHLYYTGPHVFALGKNGKGIAEDIDSPNYTLIPGCTLDNGGYEVLDDRPMTPAPQWLIDLLQMKQAAAVIDDANEAVIELDLASNIAWTIDYLKGNAPQSIEGDGGEFTLLKVAMSLRDMGISFERAVELIDEHYNTPEHCTPTWDFDELRVKVRNGYTYASKRRIGEASAQAEFMAEPLPSIPAEIMGHERSKNFTTVMGMQFSVARTPRKKRAKR